MQQKSHLPADPNRPLLILNYDPKAAGSTIGKVLEDMKPCNIPLAKYKKMDYLSDDEIKYCYVTAREDQNIGYNMRQKGFVIGSVREPCEQYLFLWIYGSTGQGDVRKGLEMRQSKDWVKSAYGSKAPFDSQKEINAFRNIWLKEEKVNGIVANRFLFSYKSPMYKTLEVDCWVFVDNFNPSLLSCLRQYEEQGGWVDWKAPHMSDLVKEVTKAKNLQKQNVVSNKEHGDPNFVQLPHSSHSDNDRCSLYFDEETSKRIENGPEKFFYDTFGYTGCCGERKDRAEDHADRLREIAKVKQSAQKQEQNVDLLLKEQQSISFIPVMMCMIMFGYYLSRRFFED